MFEGLKKRIGDQDYIVPPLTLGQLRRGVAEQIREHDKLLNEGKTFDAILLRTVIIGHAIRRNYPDMTDEKLDEVLDAKNSTDIFLAVMGASGMNEPEGPEAVNGAVKDPTPSGQSTTD